MSGDPWGPGEAGPGPAPQEELRGSEAGNHPKELPWDWPGVWLSGRVCDDLVWSPNTTGVTQTPPSDIEIKEWKRPVPVAAPWSCWFNDWH